MARRRSRYSRRLHRRCRWKLLVAVWSSQSSQQTPSRSGMGLLGRRILRRPNACRTTSPSHFRRNKPTDPKARTRQRHWCWAARQVGRSRACGAADCWYQGCGLRSAMARRRSRYSRRLHRRCRWKLLVAVWSSQSSQQTPSRSGMGLLGRRILRRPNACRTTSPSTPGQRTCVERDSHRLLAATATPA